MASGQPPGTDPLKPWNQAEETSAPSTRDVQQRGMPAMTEEERQVMKECERDSFYQRGLPLSLGCMVGAHMLVRSGRWAAHPRFGSLPKVIILGSIGYFAGKISYLPMCQQKILDRIPNSNLAAAIRKSRGLQEPELQVAASEESSSSSKSDKLKDDYTVLPGLDDRFRPSMDRDVKPREEPPEEKSSISYEELRRRNRQEYEDNVAKRPPKPPGAPSYKDSPLMPQRPWPEAGDKSRPPAKSEEFDSSLDSPPPPPPSDTPTRKKRTNMWGDPIED